MMVLVLLALVVPASESSPLVIFDFSRSDDISAWVSVNDVVMGGQSSGELEGTSEGTALFSGSVSFENGGGFASVRTRPKRHDLHQHDGLRLRIRGDGRLYKLNLKLDGYLDGVMYRAIFQTKADDWQTIFLPFSQFEPTFRGRSAPDAPTFDASRIASFGLMISDRQEGPFRLELAWIRAAELGSQ